MSDSPNINPFHETVFYEQSQVGMLELRGDTRADFLQRQTTNDTRRISSQGILTSVLTSPTGRILDVLYLFEDQASNEPVIQAITLPGHAPATASYLKSRIFFKDQVELWEISANYIHMDLSGPGIQHVLQKLDLPALLETGQLASTHPGDIEIKVFKHNPQLGLGIRLFTFAEFRERIRSILSEAGVKELNHNDYEILRVEAGLPAASHELVEEHTPLEVNLVNAISENKGCYTGQEVIARQMTYDKVTRKLVGLNLDREIQVGAQFFAEGKLAGIVTSSVVSPRFGPIALGIIKRPYHQPGIELTSTEGENTITARVTSLPFI
jgi:folate-binding protein YgfZ